MLDEAAQQVVIRGLRDGRREAWAALYDGYSADVWRYVARLIGGDAGAVADVVQQTFLAAAQSARDFNPQRGTLWAWLTGIAQHHVSHHWRRAAQPARWKALAAIGALDVREANDSLAADFDRKGLCDLVRHVLAELTADYAALLIGKYLDDQSLAELAQIHGLSPDATKSKLARARQEFRSRYERRTRNQS